MNKKSNIPGLGHRKTIKKSNQHPIKLFFAILNTGWVRRELINTVIEVGNTPGIEMFLLNPSLTDRKPIAFNRCEIIKRFLQSDCELILMLDSDVVPFHNPAEMVFLDKDIVSSPTRVNLINRLTWVVYKKHPEIAGSYSSMNIDNINSNVELLKVDAVGTGCVLIKRRVLEKIKKPFEYVFDKDGILIKAADGNFCKKATEAGFEIFVTLQKRCEHFKEIGLVSSDSYWMDYSKDEKLIRGWNKTKKVTRLLDAETGLRECKVCGHRYTANLPTNALIDGRGDYLRYYPSSWPCPKGCNIP